MTGSPPPRADRGTARRFLIWLLIAIAIVAGIVLYFQYAGRVVPLMGQVR